MILGIDVGNTNITFGIFVNSKIINSFRITTNNYLTSDEIGVRMKNILIAKGFNVENIEDIIVASVVPSIMDSLIPGCEEYLLKKPILLNNEMNFGIGLKTDYPNEIGIDRIVDMVAAKIEYGAPAIVIDYGTANTYDILDEENNYIAGLTTPGIRTSLNGLVSKAAKLTNIEIKAPKSILAKNTKDSMNAGLILGHVGQTKYIIEEMQKAINKKCKVVITGGLGNLIKDYFAQEAVYDEFLTLKGLMYIYERIQSSNR